MREKVKPKDLCKGIMYRITLTKLLGGSNATKNEAAYDYGRRCGHEDADPTAKVGDHRSLHYLTERMRDIITHLEEMDDNDEYATFSDAIKTLGEPSKFSMPKMQKYSWQRKWLK
ncbi:hypothetical protein Fot_42536 [Forsythia ovata]|uniref:Uncharacterized protein n=1 Tax=Forsythia ovata TaxID=205694 RepID=A0ABD1RLG3_9LAMI